MGELFDYLYLVAIEAQRQGDNNRAKILMETYRGKDTVRFKKAKELWKSFKPSVDNCPQSDQPTPETKVKARMQRDPLSNMKLTHDQERAAKQIREIYEHLVLALGVKCGDPSRVVVDTSFSTPLIPGQNMPPHVEDRLNHVYKPWAQSPESMRDIATNHHRLSRLALVIAVLIDRESFRTLERYHRIRNGTLKAELESMLDSFNQYARRYSRAA